MRVWGLLRLLMSTCDQRLLRIRLKQCHRGHPAPLTPDLDEAGIVQPAQCVVTSIA